MKRYIGQKEVVLSELSKFEGNNGESIETVKVTYADGSVELLTKKMFEAIAKTDPCDLTALRELRIYPITKDILRLFLEYGLKDDEVTYLFSVIEMSLNNTRKELMKAIFKKEPTENNFLDYEMKLKELRG